MQQSMYSAMFGALTQEIRMDVIANNLANINVSGFKRDQLAFKDVFTRYAHDDVREPSMHLRDQQLFPDPMYLSKPRIGIAKTDFSQGGIRQTGSPMDMAIAGDGFFKIRTPDGDFLTRNGHFVRGPNGQMVNDQGLPLVGENGPITLPDGGKVVINGGGQIFVDGELVNTVQMVYVDDPAMLEKLGGSLYRPRGEDLVQEVPATDAVIHQGFLERANVDVVKEMVNMIETQRSFEAYQKTMAQTQETDVKVITQIGLVR